MIRLKQFLICMLPLLLITSCASAPESRKEQPSTIAKKSLPQWASIGKDLRYPNELYITASGESGSVENADKVAMVRIAEQIQVSIKSELTLYRRATEKSGIVESEKDMSMSIDTSVDVKDLDGLAIVDRYYDDRSNI
ncbi:MAG: LPP20 family lipoprotein, partial [Proteobacteria bacterium]|nr:LPP20 family lipoprotein [Pseudomonadota bacterium]